MYYCFDLLRHSTITWPETNWSTFLVLTVTTKVGTLTLWASKEKEKKLNLSLFVCCLFFLLLLTMYRVGEGEVGRARIPGAIYKCTIRAWGFAVIILGAITRFSLFHYSPRVWCGHSLSVRWNRQPATCWEETPIAITRTTWETFIQSLHVW